MLATTAAPGALLRELAASVGENNVYSRPADLAAYAYDSFGASGNRALPLAVVFPKTTKEVSAVVSACRALGVPVVARGAGTGYSGGAVGSGAVILSLVRMSKVYAPDVKAMRIRAEAGAITAAIADRAAQTRLYYPPDPGSRSTSTIGGNVACNASGPHSLRYGSTADYVTDLTIVFADGSVETVGESLGKGFDVMAVMCGSEGTLGIVTEVTLRLLPAPAARATLRAVFDSMQSAAAAVSAINKAGVLPAALECLDTAACDAVRNAGVAEVPEGVGALVFAEVEGDAKTVDADAEKVRAALTGAGAGMVEHATDAEHAHRLWAARHAVSAAVATIVVGKVNEDVVVPIPKIGDLCTKVRELGTAHELPTVVFGHLGEGNLHVSFLIDPRHDGERERADKAVGELFEAVLEMGGSLTGEHGVGTVKLPWIESQLGAENLALMQRIKHSFDPQGLLNPGKKIPSADQ